MVIPWFGRTRLISQSADLGWEVRGVDASMRVNVVQWGLLIRVMGHQ